MIIGLPGKSNNRSTASPCSPPPPTSSSSGGHSVVVERNAGTGSGYPDADYEQAGATLVDSHAAVFEQADLIVKVKEPLPEEYPCCARARSSSPTCTWPPTGR